MQELAPNNPATSPAAGTGRRSTLLIAGVVGIVALVAGAVGGALFLSSSAEPTGPVDATATIVVRPAGPPASVEEDGNRIQFRDLTLAGEITLTTPDGRQITGDLSFGENEDITFGEAGPEIAHIWGPVTATLDGSACEGSFAVTTLFATGEEGGALALRCEDGTALGGNLREAQVEVGPDGLLEQLTRELTGWYVPVD
jgi:hypothetical protein